MTPDLEKELADLALRAHRIPFFALVRHLERLLAGRARVGGVGPASEESVRFAHDIRPVFHASDVTALRIVGREPPRVEVTTGFLGVVGSVSPLANYFTDDILRADALDERSVQAFYDLFHHRLIAFIYGAELRASAWAEIRADASDRVTRRSLYLAGFTARPARVAGLAPGQWVGLARIFGRRPRGRPALDAALAAGFPGVAVRVLDFLDRDLSLPSGERSQLGVRNVTLGRGARLGSRLLRQTGFLRLVIGPVGRDELDGLLRGTAGHARLRAIVDSVTGGMLDVEAEIEIKRGEEPRARLGARNGTRLGHNAVIVRPRAARPLFVRVPLSGDASEDRPVFEVPPA